MDTYLPYALIFVLLLVLEIIYSRIAYSCNFKVRFPRSRSILRGGGIIYLVGIWVWVCSFSIFDIQTPWFLGGLTLAALASFIDDGRWMPRWIQWIIRTAAAVMVLYQLGLLDIEWFLRNGWVVSCLIFAAALIVSVGAVKVINAMDGINGITAGYSLAVLLPLAVMNSTGHGALNLTVVTGEGVFLPQSLVIVTILSVLVFCLFNFQVKGRVRCYSGDVGSIGMAYILLFIIGSLVKSTGDVTYLIFLLVYAVEGVMSLGRRKHAYQVMAENLNMSFETITLIYVALQLVVSLGFIYECPDTVVAHWIFLIVAFLLLAVGHFMFMKKYHVAK